MNAGEPVAALDLSVVIPTRNRPARLAETLETLSARREEARFEVLVVDDGSDASAVDALRALAGRSWPFALRTIETSARGPAAARNRGVTAARAARVLFLGDDTRPAPRCLARHAARDGTSSSRRTVAAVQGHIDWDPAHEITPLMDFLAPAGPQFYFRGLSDGEPVPFTAVLGSNLSASRDWLLAEPFDEGFPHAALEDTELAWRWRRRGWEAVYARDAVCWHHHHYDALEPFLERQRRAGRSARRAVRKHPRLLWPLVLQPSLMSVVVAARGVARRSAEWRWDLACRGALLRGFLESSRNRPGV